MSRLETAAQPILVPLMEGKDLTLGPESLRLLAQWAVKTALLYEVMKYPADERYFKREDRSGLHTSLAIPPTTYVWAARYIGVEIGTYSIGGHMHGRFHDSPTATAELYSATHRIDQLVLQILSFRPPDGYNGGPIGLGIPDTWGDAEIAVHPAVATQQWPPRLGLDDAEFTAFATRWTAAGLFS